MKPFISHYVMKRDGKRLSVILQLDGEAVYMPLSLSPSRSSSTPVALAMAWLLPLCPAVNRWDAYNKPILQALMVYCQKY